MINNFVIEVLIETACGTWRVCWFHFRFLGWVTTYYVSDRLAWDVTFIRSGLIFSFKFYWRFVEICNCCIDQFFNLFTMKIIISFLQPIFNEDSSIDPSFNLRKELFIILLLPQFPHFSLNLLEGRILSSINCEATIIDHFPLLSVFLLLLLLIQIEFSLLSFSRRGNRLFLQ